MLNIDPLTLFHDEYATMSLGCIGCRDLGTCGGLFVQAPIFSCLDFCRCSSIGADHYVCPCNTKDFVKRLREVKGLGLENVPRVPLLNYPTLPAAVPLLYARYQRVKYLRSRAVAIPLNLLFSRKTGQIKFSNREELAERFRFDRSAKLLISGVGEDGPIEDYWKHRRKAALVRQIAKLEPDLITGPNYSLFIDVPRWDNLHNIKRIALCWSELVAEGLPASLHINARTVEDWRAWTKFIYDREEARSLSIEFATPSHVSRVQWHTQKLITLAANVERDLQIVVRGGSMQLPAINRAFHQTTFLDSWSYMKTIKRRRLFWRPGCKGVWRPSLTPLNSPLDDLLQHNSDLFAEFTAHRLSLLW
jgi:hypothetical protein